ncbi:MAG: hypothetical protein ABI778_10080 [Ignavibacteriota bacterium]
MKIVRVTYTTNPEYSEQNQSNIKQVMTDLGEIANPGINYSTCLASDGVTFTHSAFFNSDDAEKVLFALPSFIHFQQRLKESGLQAPPKQEILTLVGSSKPIF